MRTYEVDHAENAPRSDSDNPPPRGTVILRGMPKALDNAQPVFYLMAELEEISTMKEKTHYFIDAIRGGVTMYKHGIHLTWMKVTQWNKDCVETVFIRQELPGGAYRWMMIRDRVPADMFETVCF